MSTIGIRWVGRDRFADPRFTERQQQLAAHSTSGIVYTPEVILDGHEWRDWYRGTMPKTPASRLMLDLNITPGKPLQADLTAVSKTATDMSVLRGYFAVTENNRTSAVKAGENRGATLHHDHVVRTLAGPMPLANARADLVLPADLDASNASLVAFVANANDGSIVQALLLPLGGCVSER